MEYIRFTCDVCGAEKGSSEDWFAVRPDPDFTVRPWVYKALALGRWEHICGQECLHKRLSRWLECNAINQEVSA